MSTPIGWPSRSASPTRSRTSSRTWNAMPNSSPYRASDSDWSSASSAHSAPSRHAHRNSIAAFPRIDSRCSSIVRSGSESWGHLTRLSDAQLADRRRQDRRRAGSDTRGELTGLRQHEISGEQCRAGALDGVDRRCAAPRQRAVEQVIVDQRANLDELGGRRRSYDALVVDAAEPGAGDGERRTQALAASVGDPPTRGGQRRWTVKGVLEATPAVTELG